LASSNLLAEAFPAGPPLGNIFENWEQIDRGLSARLEDDRPFLEHVREGGKERACAAWRADAGKDGRDDGVSEPEGVFEELLEKPNLVDQWESQTLT